MHWLSGDAYVPVDDRGLNYGDGLFETMYCVGGRIPFLDLHMQRLARGATALRIAGIDCERIAKRLTRGIAQQTDAEGWLKLTITRRSSARGYAPSEDVSPRIIVRHGPLSLDDAPLRVRICQARLPFDPQLAGIKHLNRLPQVMAAQELGGEIGVEGLMCDHHGSVVCGIMHNVFIVTDNQLLTPALEACGVAGVMRQWVIETASAGSVEIGSISVAQLRAADEIILTNAVRGIRSASHLADHRLPSASPVADALRDQLSARRTA
ncbi:MAG: aminodeoxychorismate lyase [Pseudomonadota bacterium]